MDYLYKFVKTTCGFVNIAKKAEIARRKVVFQPKQQVLPHSDRIWTALYLDPLALDFLFTIFFAMCGSYLLMWCRYCHNKYYCLSL